MKINDNMLRERTICITGAYGYLGREFANTLLELGANLALVDINASVHDLALELSKKQKGIVKGYVCNLEKYEELIALPQKIFDDFSSFDVLINNAAFVGTSNLEGWCVPFEEQSYNTWNRAISVNLTASFFLIQSACKFLRKSKKGSIINIGSIYGAVAPDWSLYENTGMGNPGAYGVSKAGLIHMTKYLSTALAPDIRVNAVSPGGIIRGQNKIFIDRYNKKTPLERMAKESDISGTIVWLASDMSLYVTGQHILVDGGFSVW